MNIRRIDAKTTFGYDKQLNKDLVNKLKEDKTHHPDLIKTIQSLNSYCNRTENMINSNIQNSDLSGQLYEAFLSSKLTLANLVDWTYPELNYNSTEMMHYMKESHGFIHDWHFGVATEFSSLIQSNREIYGENDNFGVVAVDPSELTPEEKEIIDAFEEAETQYDNTNNKNVPPNKDATTKDDEEVQITDLVEFFKPTFSSPKGFESVGGMENLKEELYDKVIFPLINPEEAERDLEDYGKQYPRGIMLYGPPGCGKTFILEALAQEAKIPLFKLKISKAGSKFINETSKNYQKVFDYVADFSDKICSPVILFIDEFDGMSMNRDDDSSEESLKQIGTLLNLIETARDRNIIVVVATNKYDLIDDAIRSRFDGQFYVGMPNADTREKVLGKTLNNWKKGQELAQNQEEMKKLGQMTEGFPSRALVILADIASDLARKDGRRNISLKDFEVAIDKNQNHKIDESKYVSKANRQMIGFNNSKS